MPRLVSDDTVEGFKRTGLLPKDKPTPVPIRAEEKENPIVVNVTLEQDNYKVDKILEALITPKVKKLEQWEFTIERDDDGNMSKIFARQTE